MRADSPVIEDIHLDHVAVAVERRSDAWARYGGDLPGRFLGGGTGTGFANYQLEYAGGMRLEVLEPARVTDNDFLRRFLDRSGPGSHHLTYKVGDIGAAAAAAEAAGYRPVGVALQDANWKELFLHPRDIPGVVVQLAWSAVDGWRADPPGGFPARRTAPDAALERVVHAVADLDDGLRLFAGLLDGHEAGRGDGPDGRWVELGWPGGGTVRLVTPSSPESLLAAWIGDRPGRVHHLAFATDEPGGVPDAVALEGMGEPVWEVPPDRNLGVRLRLRPLP